MLASPIRPPGLKLLTSSRKRTFRRCPRLHYLTYDLGWRSTAYSDPLAFGTLGHDALECWWVEHIADPAVRDQHWRRIWARRGVAVEGEGRAEWAPDPLGCALDAIGVSRADPFLKARVRAAIRGYDAIWAPSMGRFVVLAVECEFVVPLINPASGRSSRLWALAGKMDAIVLDKEADVIAPMEHKTTSKDITEGGRYWKRLRLDGQLSTYIRGARASADNQRIDRAGYDVLKRPEQRPFKATPPEERKFTKPTKTEPSRLYANQHEQDETPEEFEARVSAAIAGREHELYVRDWVTRTDAELATAAADDWSQAKLMHAAAASGGELAIRNTDACDGEDGACDFLDVCYFGMDQLQDLSRFRRTDSVHEELFDVSEPPLAALATTQEGPTDEE